MTLDEFVAELVALQAAGHGQARMFYEYDCAFHPVDPRPDATAWATTVTVHTENGRLGDYPERCIGHHPDPAEVATVIVLGDNPCAG
jgi:hypothetical protein